MINLTNINKRFINNVILYLIICAILLFFILQIKVEKSFHGIINIDEEKEIILVINNSDYYFIQNEKTINFFLNNKLYIINNISLTPLPNNQFSIKIFDQNLKDILQPNTSLKININVGVQKLYMLFLKN